MPAGEKGGINSAEGCETFKRDANAISCSNSIYGNISLLLLFRKRENVINRFGSQNCAWRRVEHWTHPIEINEIHTGRGGGGKILLISMQTRFLKNYQTHGIVLDIDPSNKRTTPVGCAIKGKSRAELSHFHQTQFWHSSRAYLKILFKKFFRYFLPRLNQRLEAICFNSRFCHFLPT